MCVGEFGSLYVNVHVCECALVYGCESMQVCVCVYVCVSVGVYVRVL